MKITKLFTQLVKISSPSGKEEQVSVFIQSWLKSHDFEYKVDSIGNIYAKNNKAGVPLLLCAHMDTVQPGENIHPIIEDGIVKSNGKTILGADNKAALAALLTALEEGTAEKNIELLFTVKEETGGGVEFFPFKWIQSKQALIFDSAKPLGGIVLGSPYIYNFYIQFIGKSAHASTPEAGINAFTPAFEVLSTLKTGTMDNGKTTINVGLVSGGTGINTVPSTISIKGEARSYDKKLFDSHISDIKKMVKASSKKYGVDSTFELKEYCAGYTHKEKEQLSKKIADIYSKLGLKTDFYTHSGISDANVLNAHSIETYNLTDGVEFPHTTEEQISVKNLITLSNIIKKCISNL